MPFYAVARGRNPGLYDNWQDCSNQVNQFSGSKFQKFLSRNDAIGFLNKNGIYFDCSSSDDDDNSSEYSVTENGFVNVYTDGCCLNNGYGNAKGGIGVWFGSNHRLNVSKPLLGRQTNNRAEIKAVTIAANQAKRAGIERIRINTDSEYLCNSINVWMRGWRQNGWITSDGNPVSNKWDLISMEKALSQLDDYSLRRIPAHSGIYGNEMADKLAREGALMG